jgi:hypothetical protein
MEAYPQEFYASMRDKTTYSANTILDIVLQRIPAVHSAVDVGCGVGNWLAVLREKGATEIQGLDGSWVDQDLLAIPRSNFKQVDLSRSAIELPRRYDLAISLEMAEHLPPDRAEEFVTSLTALSDYVLFSAAIPFQGGINHLNEQWQHYWADLFAARGYGVHDFIRPGSGTTARFHSGTGRTHFWSPTKRRPMIPRATTPGRCPSISCIQGSIRDMPRRRRAASGAAGGTSTGRCETTSAESSERPAERGHRSGRRAAGKPTLG